MTVYLVCLDRPVGDPASRTGYAGHYCGTCKPGRLAARMREEARGHGSCLMAAAARAVIGFELVRTWPGSYAEERKIKGRPKGSRELREKCPRCNIMPRISRWAGGRCRQLRYERKVITMPALAECGYSEAAAVVRRELPGWAGDRRQVSMWAARRTPNARGEPFPAGPPFAEAELITWLAGGLPSRAATVARMKRDQLGRFAA